MQEQFLQVEGSKMRCVFSSPKERTHKAIIVLQEAFGVNSHIQNMVKRFCDEGYLAIAPELFHRTAQPGFTCPYMDFQAAAPHFQGISEAGLVEDVLACQTWLREAHGASQIGVVGFCLGGRAAVITNAHLSLQAAAGFYGGRIPSYVHLAKDQRAPLLTGWGGLDKHIPPEEIQSLYQALRAVNKNFIGIEFAQADHGFFCDERASYEPASARQAWALTLQFFKEYLK